MTEAMATRLLWCQNLLSREKIGKMSRFVNAATLGELRV